MLSTTSLRHRIQGVTVLLAVVLIQTCLGGVYAWSAFVPSLTKDHGLSMSQAQSVFGWAILTFAMAMLWAGYLLARWGPRWMALVSAALFAGGHMYAAGSGARFAGLVVGYGWTAGAGLGFGYITALVTGQQWFPRRKGMVTGVAVAGFGLGGLLLASFIEKWSRGGWTVPDMFRAVGWAYGAVLALGALLLCRPSGVVAGGMPDAAAGRRFLKSKGFRVLALGMFCGTFAGLLVIGLLKPMGLSAGLSPANATRAIGGLAVGNVAGRVVWGWLFDRTGSRTIPASLLLLCLAMGSLALARSSPIGFMAVSCLVGFGFGACFVLYAAQVAASHGAGQVGRLYPFLFLSYGVAGVIGPFVGGLLHDWSGGYSLSLAVGALVAAMGVWLTWRAPAIMEESSPA